MTSAWFDKIVYSFVLQYAFLGKKARQRREPNLDNPKTISPFIGCEGRNVPWPPWAVEVILGLLCHASSAKEKRQLEVEICTLHHMIWGRRHRLIFYPGCMIYELR
jgi:hypothetical protein